MSANLPTYVSIDESFVGPGYLGLANSPLRQEPNMLFLTQAVRGVFRSKEA